MAVEIVVPRLGWTMEEGTLVEWLKRDGDAVRPGDPLFVLEGDKAAETIEATDTGLLRMSQASPKGGDKVKVGQVIAHLVAAGEEVPAGGPRQPPVATFKPGADVPRSPQPIANVASSAETRGRVASPRARRVARELGVDWQKVPGTGRNGRVRERDIRATAGTESSGRLVPHTNIRRLIAARMVAGVTQAAPVTLTTKADATNLVARRASLDCQPSYTDLIVVLTAAALRQHPMVQAQWREDGLFVPSCVHIAVAIDTDRGLLAPVLSDADRLPIQEIVARSRELVTQARAGKLKPEQMRDATFTVTNLGMFGVDAFTPIVHLPQSAILGVGRVVREPAVVGDAVVPRDMLTLSLTFDHRVIDGAPAARFLDAIRRAVEAAQLPAPGTSER